MEDSAEQSFIDELGSVDICKIVQHDGLEWVLVNSSLNYHWCLWDSMSPDLQVKAELFKQKSLPTYLTIVKSADSQSQASSFRSMGSSHLTPHAYTVPVREDSSGRVSFDLSQGFNEGFEHPNQIDGLKAKLSKNKEVKSILKFKVNELTSALRESLSTITHGEDQVAAGAMMKKSVLELAQTLPPM